MKKRSAASCHKTRLGLACHQWAIKPHTHITFDSLVMAHWRGGVLEARGLGGCAARRRSSESVRISGCSRAQCRVQTPIRQQSSTTPYTPPTTSHKYAVAELAGIREALAPTAEYFNTLGLPAPLIKFGHPGWFWHKGARSAGFGGGWAAPGIWQLHQQTKRGATLTGPPQRKTMDTPPTLNIPTPQLTHRQHGGRAPGHGRLRQLAGLADPHLRRRGERCAS